MEELKGAISFKCKYCKAVTRHIIIGTVEYQGKQTEQVKCYVCEYTKILYRDPKTKRIMIDESGVPERIIVLPHDLEYRQTQIETEMEEEHNKQVDDWLKDEKERVGYDKKIKGKKYPGRN